MYNSKRTAKVKFTKAMDKHQSRQGMVVCACDSSTEETEAIDLVIECFRPPSVGNRKGLVPTDQGNQEC